jgi:hypothetical protein
LYMVIALSLARRSPSSFGEAADGETARPSSLPHLPNGQYHARQLRAL